ncbi:inorganic phosphate transporter [Gorillibacterium sp. sgz500922]|uniref:inorganic phosphate transporter n=1 Tax=Gorillibacterium sp. sgz500922 TaxID=3446694 RepID=UPI003F6798CA
MTSIVIIVILALLFDFINGFHDTANAIATSVSTKALKPRFAIFYAAILNFIGAIIAEGVAHSIGKGIADPSRLENGLHIVIAALISMILWNLLTWMLGIPSSSSHTLIGSLVGAVVAGAGFQEIHWSGFGTILSGLLLSPFIAFVAGFIILKIIRQLLRWFGKTSPGTINKGFRSMQILSAGWQALSHGMNDAQKAMGIIFFALVSGGYLDSTSHIPLWVKLAAATAMGLGTSIGGWKIIQTVGSKIIKIEPMNGFASDLTSATVLSVGTHFGLPLSTTHVVTSAIIGTGTAIRARSINWGIVGTMIMTWVITIPISMVIGYLTYHLIFTLFF